MPADVRLPPLWSPEELFSHLALWAGVPAILVAVVVWLLGLYQSAKGWVDLATSTTGKIDAVKTSIQTLISARKRAAVRLAVASVFAVALAYMLAVILSGLGQLDPNEIMTARVVESSVAVTALSPAAVWTVLLAVVGIGLLGISHIACLPGLRKFVTFFGGVAYVISWIWGILLAIGSLLSLGEFALGNKMANPPPPLAFIVTVGITAALCIAVAKILPKIDKASRAAFGAP